MARLGYIRRRKSASSHDAERTIQLLEARMLLSRALFPGEAFAPGAVGSLAMADLNGDAQLDIATVKSTSGLGILLDDSNGGYQPMVSYAVGVSPRGIAVSDLNADGHPDVVVVNGGTYATSYAGSVSVLLGNGDGTLQPQQGYPVGNDAEDVALADLNKDGRPDIVCANKGANTVGVLLGNGNGTFQPQQTFAVGQIPFALAVSDLNGDGKLDVVTANYAYTASTVSVLLGNGDGTFLPQSQLDAGAGARPSSITIGDFNKDHKPDIVTEDRVAMAVSVFFGNGDGSFQARQTIPVLYPSYVAVADVNLDANADIVCSNNSNTDALNTVSVILGNGDGTFQSPAIFTVAGFAGSMAVADVNSDNKPDITMAGGSVVRLLGNGDGTFQSAQCSIVGVCPTDVVSGDFNGDSHLDLAVVNLDSGTLSVLLNRGGGSFEPQREFADIYMPTALAVDDVNRDGMLDLVVASYGSTYVSVLLGNGDGTFEQQPALRVTVRPMSVAVADINRDGFLDILTANSGEFQTYVGTVSLLLGNGDGTFQPERTFAVDTLPRAIAVADLDGDGILDIATANGGAYPNYIGTVSLLIGVGDGTFLPQRIIPVDSYASSITATDINADGRPDLVVANYQAARVNVLLNKGGATFDPPRAFAVGRSPETPVVADIDGDGRLDILTPNHDANTLSVLLGNGDGTFRPQRLFAAGEMPAGLAVADLNDDGKPDAIVTAYYSNYVSVLSNLVAPAVTDCELVLAAPGPRVRVKFNWNVSATVSLADVTVRSVAGGTTVAVTGFDYDPTTNTATIMLPTTLADGTYRITLAASGVADRSGIAMEADFSQTFFVLAGDANRDRVVDISDLAILATHWQQSPRDFSHGDFNYDAVVDAADLSILATRWQNSLSASTPLVRSPARRVVSNAVALIDRTDTKTILDEVGATVIRRL